MLVKTTQYKSSGISSANLLRALEIFDLPPAISPELNKCPNSNPVTKMGIFYLAKAFHAGKKIRKNDFAPSKKYSSCASGGRDRI